MPAPVEVCVRGGRMCVCELCVCADTDLATETRVMPFIILMQFNLSASGAYE